MAVGAGMGFYSLGFGRGIEYLWASQFTSAKMCSNVLADEHHKMNNCQLNFHLIKIKDWNPLDHRKANYKITLGLPKNVNRRLSRFEIFKIKIELRWTTWKSMTLQSLHISAWKLRFKRFFAEFVLFLFDLWARFRKSRIPFPSSKKMRKFSLILHAVDEEKVERSLKQKGRTEL